MMDDKIRRSTLSTLSLDAQNVVSNLTLQNDQNPEHLKGNSRRSK